MEPKKIVNVPVVIPDDHDILVALTVKVDQLGLDIKDIKENTMVRINRLESWKDTVDIYHARIDLPKYERLAAWAENVKSNYKFLVALVALAAGLVGGLVDHIVQTWFPTLK